MLFAVVVRKRLTGHFGAWNAALIACDLYLVAVVVVASVLPMVNEVPESFPASVSWQFRLASFGIQFVMWTTLGLTFACLTERALIKSGAHGRTALFGRSARASF